MVRRFRACCILLLGLFALSPAFAQPPFAALPRSTPNPALPDTTGYTVVQVNAGGNLQAALNTALASSGGTVIKVQAGATFTGTYTLGARSVCDPTKQIIIQTDSNSLPASGTTVTWADISHMPKIIATGTNTPITVTSGACYIHFVGLRVANGNSSTAAVTYDAIALGEGTDTSPATMPHHIYVDRCYVDASVGNLRRAVRLDGVNLAVVDSWLVAHEIYTAGDSQAILGYNGPGPFLIDHNHIEGSSENIMFGGAQPAYTANVPSDITITRNHIMKPLTWRPGDPSYGGTHWGVKNLLELKNAQYVLIEGNILERNWGQEQPPGYAILLTPRPEQSGAQTVTSDVTIRYNLIRRVAGGLSIMGRSTAYDTTRRTERVVLNDNVWELDYSVWSQSASGEGTRPQLITNGAYGVHWQHNTILSNGANINSATYFVPGGYAFAGYAFENNIVPAGSYGLLVEGCGNGDPCFSTTAAPGNSYRTNVVTGTISGYGFPRVGTDTLNIAALTNVGFANYNSGVGGDYRLCTGVNLPASPCARASAFHNAGSDGKDIGADIATFNAKTASVAP